VVVVVVVDNAFLSEAEIVEGCVDVGGDDDNDEVSE
jgi:hypothetical protein